MPFSRRFARLLFSTGALAFMLAAHAETATIPESVRHAADTYVPANGPPARRLIRTIRVRWARCDQRTTRHCRSAVALDIWLPVARNAGRSVECSARQVAHIDSNPRIPADRSLEE